MNKIINKKCHILKNYDVGGVQKIVFDITTSSPKNHVVICGYKGKLGLLSEKSGVEVIELHTLNKLLLLQRIFILLKKVQFNNIYLHYSIEGLIVCNLLGIKFIEVWHNEYYLLSKFKKKLYSFLLNRKDIYSFSRKVIDTNCELFNIKKEYVKKITYGINIDIFRKDNNNFNKLIFGFAARNDDAKGIGDYIQIVKNITTNSFKLKTNNINSLPLLPNLELQEFSLEILDFYRSINIFVITSKRESGPLTLLENMACGNIVISSDVGIVKEVIKHGENGFVFDVGDFNCVFEIIETINKMTISKRLEISNNAKLTIQKNHTIKNMIRSL